MRILNLSLEEGFSFEGLCDWEDDGLDPVFFLTTCHCCCLSIGAKEGVAFLQSFAKWPYSWHCLHFNGSLS